MAARTRTAVITCLILSRLQNFQNHDTRIIQLKLDDLIRANEVARDTLLGVEDLTKKREGIKAAFDLLAASGDVPDALRQIQMGLRKRRKASRTPKSILHTPLKTSSAKGSR